MTLYQKSPFIFKPFFKPFDFRGRSSRKEFWLFQIVVISAAFAVGFLSGIAEVTGEVAWLWIAAATGLSIAPVQMSVIVRRLHDAEFSGWWLLLYLLAHVNRYGSGVIYFVFYVVFMLRKGTVGPNKYGDDPYSESVCIDVKSDENLIKVALFWIGSCSHWLAGIILGMFHLLTVYVAATVSGFIAMSVTFFLPLLSEGYWLIKIISKYGVMHYYPLCLFIGVGLIVCGYGCFGLATVFNVRKSRQDTYPPLIDSETTSQKGASDDEEAFADGYCDIIEKITESLVHDSIIKERTKMSSLLQIKYIWEQLAGSFISVVRFNAKIRWGEKFSCFVAEHTLAALKCKLGDGWIAACKEVDEVGLLIWKEMFNKASKEDFSIASQSIAAEKVIYAVFQSAIPEDEFGVFRSRYFDAAQQMCSEMMALYQTYGLLDANGNVC